MSQSVFNRNKTKSTVADTIISQMHDEDNPDMSVDFEGYMHGGKGFALKVSNLEKITEYTKNVWKSVIEAQGLKPQIVTDMMSGTVDIKCTTVENKKRSYGGKYLNSLAYLSLVIFFIYCLWIRHRP